MADKQRVVIDGGAQLLIADVKRGPKGPVVQLRLFDETGSHVFVLEDVDAKELLPVLRAIINPSSNAATLTAVEAADDGGVDDE